MKVLYISDLDGTLLKNDCSVSEYTVNGINEFIQKGGYFSVATARSPATAVPLLSKINFKAPSVLMNGVFVFDIKENKSIKTFSMSEKEAYFVIEIFEKHNKSPFFFLYTGEWLEVQFTDLKLQVHKKFYSDRKQTSFKHFDKVERYNIKNGCEPVYFSLVDEYEQVKPIYDEVIKIDGVNAVLYKDTYSPYWFIEVFSDKAGKPNGIRFIKEKYGFDKIIAFGDNLNDIEMFKLCDEGYAVSNARDELKEIATGVIDTNENDAVAEFLLGRGERSVKSI